MSARDRLRSGRLPPSAERAQLERARAVGPAAGDRRRASPPDFLRQASGWRRERARPLRGEGITACRAALRGAVHACLPLSCYAVGMLAVAAALLPHMRPAYHAAPIRAPAARASPTAPARAHLSHTNSRAKHAPRSPGRDFLGRGPSRLARTPIGPVGPPRTRAGAGLGGKAAVAVAAQVALFAFVNRGENVHEGIHLATCANQLLQMQPADGAAPSSSRRATRGILVCNVRRTSCNQRAKCSAA